jgi:ribose transport system ATP-binding protein
MGSPIPLLELTGISKAFGGVSALRDVDFALQSGEIHGLVGENGAGKSTLMKIIAGVYTDYQGTMRLRGIPVRFHSARDALGAGVGMVHQELSIVPELSVAENVFLGCQPTSGLGIVNWKQMARAATDHLQNLGIEVDPDMRMSSLSLGLQQLVELVRVLFSGARIIILDEPTSALSPPEIERLFRVLRKLREDGKSLIFISHFLEDILAVSDRLTIFRNGQKIATTSSAEIDKPWIIDRMIGTTRGEFGGSNTGDVFLKSNFDAPVTLEVTNLSIAGILRDVSLKVRRGEILGIYGFMGSGQVELAHALAGKLPTKKGAVQIEGKVVRLGSTAAAKRAGVAIVPESRRSMLFPREPVYKNISISILERFAKFFLRPDVERRIAHQRVVDLDIRPRMVDLPLGALSGGNQQKVALAKWLTYFPKVLILSEPTRGMDIAAKQDVVKIVRGLREKGIAIVVTSTEPETILALADRVVVMRKGKVAHEFADGPLGKDNLLAGA